MPGRASLGAPSDAARSQILEIPITRRQTVMWRTSSTRMKRRGEQVVLRPDLADERRVGLLGRDLDLAAPGDQLVAARTGAERRSRRAAPAAGRPAPPRSRSACRGGPGGRRGTPRRRPRSPAGNRLRDRPGSYSAMAWCSRASAAYRTARSVSSPRGSASPRPSSRARTAGRRRPRRGRCAARSPPRDGPRASSRRSRLGLDPQLRSPSGGATARPCGAPGRPPR